TNETKNADKTPLAKAPEPQASQPSLVFWTDVFPILERSCRSCHGPKKSKGNFRVDRKDDFLVPRDGKAWVIPGDPDRSPLLQIVSGARTEIAFPDRHKLPTSDAAVLKS